MNMKKIILLTLIFGFITYPLFSQNELDALKYSQIFYYGTARTMAMGGAFSGLGTDLSVSATNPAGLAFKKNNEFVISPTFSVNKTKSLFAGNSNEDFNYKFNFNTVGVLIKNDQIAFGLIYNRLNNFNMAAIIKGVNNKGSMIEYFTDAAQGTPPESLSPFDTKLAYDTYLIDTLDNPIKYTNPIRAYFGDNPKYGETQKDVIYQTGGEGETDLFGAYNFKNIMSIGLTIGFLNGTYNFNSEYSEKGFPDSIELANFTYNTYNRVEISGINVKMGIMLKPVKFIHLAGAIHSPYFYNLTDNYQTSLTSNWLTPDDEGNMHYQEQSSLNVYKYRTTAPWRAIGALGLIIGKFMALDFEYEYADYSQMRMRADDYTFETENEAISNNFKAVSNYRGGIELRLNAIYLRGGYAYYDYPIKNSDNIGIRTLYTGGLGIRTEQFFFDVAMVKTKYNKSYRFYDGYIDEPVPSLSINNTNLIFTLGWNW